MTEFEQLLDGCRRREPGAFAALVQRYLPHVRAAVRRRLTARLRSRFDSHDFTQNVWASFFQVTLERLDLPTEDALVGYLARMAELKVAEEFRHQFSQKVNVRLNLPLEAVPEPAGRVATPSVEAMAGDRWEALTAALSDRERAMLRMLRDGESYQTVGERFGMTAKTVQRLMGKLRNHPVGDRA